MRSLALLLLTLLLTACSSTPDTPPPPPQKVVKFDHFYNQWRGVPYRMGGETRKGIDCSAFTQLAYQNVLGKSLPRNTLEQVKEGIPVPRSKLRNGDLVFFKTGRRQYHVGVYTGAGQFIHVSSRKGVMRSRLNDSYWQPRYWTARRVIQ